MRRQLEDHARMEGSHAKTHKAHEAPPRGRIVEIHPRVGYGRIEAADGRLVYALMYVKAAGAGGTMIYAFVFQISALICQESISRFCRFKIARRRAACSRKLCCTMRAATM